MFEYHLEKKRAWHICHGVGEVGVHSKHQNVGAEAIYGRQCIFSCHRPVCSKFRVHRVFGCEFQNHLAQNMVVFFNQTIGPGTFRCSSQDSNITFVAQIYEFAVVEFTAVVHEYLTRASKNANPNFKYASDSLLRRNARKNSGTLIMSRNLLISYL